MARHNNDLDRWPAITDGRGQLQAIDRPWHINIRHDDPDVGSAFENANCLVGVGGFNGDETSLLDEFDGNHSQEWLVFDDENYLRLYRSRLSHLEYRRLLWPLNLCRPFKFLAQLNLAEFFSFGQITHHGFPIFLVFW